MVAWLSRKIPIYASAFFRGTWPLRKENFEHLRGYGVEMREGSEAENAIWSIELKHRKWGEATLINFRALPMPPHAMIEWDSQLIPEEVDEIKSCGTAVSLTMESTKGNVLRDRKNALCFLNAVVGEDGIAGLDHVAQKFWPRSALAAETAHDADLDVDGIMSYHAVSADEQEQIGWLHSHGLGEIGFFDFDVLRPSEDLQGIAYDLLRSIAFHIVEGTAQLGGSFAPLSGVEAIKAIKAAEFMSKANAEDRNLRDDPGSDHAEKRVVLCDLNGTVLGRLFGEKPRPSRVLSEPFKPESLIQFSTEASSLMAERAKATFGMFAEVAEELREFECSAMVKLAYRVDGEGEHDDEHLWFEYHGMKDGQIDATLLNEPFHISRMKEGQRGIHRIELLSDWGIATPGGTINPRATRPLRFIRRHKEELRAARKEDQSDLSAS